MAIHWNKVMEIVSEVERLRALHPEVPQWDESSIANHIPKAWRRIATISVGAPDSQELKERITPRFTVLVSCYFIAKPIENTDQLRPISLQLYSVVIKGGRIAIKRVSCMFRNVAGT